MQKIHLFIIVVLLTVVLIAINFQKDNKTLRTIKFGGTEFTIQPPADYNLISESKNKFYAVYSKINASSEFEIDIDSPMFNSPEKYKEYEGSPEFYARCSADGPSSSQFCDKIIEKKTWQTDGGIGVYYYKLRLVSEVYAMDDTVTQKKESTYEFYNLVFPSGQLVSVSNTYETPFIIKDVEEVIKSIKIISN